MGQDENDCDLPTPNRHSVSFKHEHKLLLPASGGNLLDRDGDPTHTVDIYHTTADCSWSLIEYCIMMQPLAVIRKKEFFSNCHRRRSFKNLGSSLSESLGYTFNFSKVQIFRMIFIHLFLIVGFPTFLAPVGLSLSGDSSCAHAGHALVLVVPRFWVWVGNYYEPETLLNS